MPRFFLHLRNHAGHIDDYEGQELADLEAARVQAIEGIRSLVSEEARHGVIDLRGSIEIADPRGNIVGVVTFSEAVKLRLNGLSP